MAFGFKRAVRRFFNGGAKTQVVEGIPRPPAEYAHNSFAGDHLYVNYRNLGFLNDPRFAKAWEIACKGNDSAWADGVPQIAWRAHINVWAATRGLALEGDFVEFGTYGALYATVIGYMLDFAKVDKRFYLFDTFTGVPTTGLQGGDLSLANTVNAHYVEDVYPIAQKNVAPFPNMELVRGRLPESLDQVKIDKISYLSMDLNNAPAEMASIAAVWDRIVDGAIIVLDDYAHVGFENQYDAWNDFARSVGRPIATLPTGQGLLIK